MQVQRNFRSFSDVLAKWQGGFPLKEGRKVVKFFTEEQFSALQKELPDVLGDSKNETVATVTEHFRFSFQRVNRNYKVTVYREN